MCSEENPATCHRRLLVGRVLADYEVEVFHIRSDGRIQSEDEIKREISKSNNNEAQQSLFGRESRDDWKSTRPVFKKTKAV